MRFARILALLVVSVLATSAHAELFRCAGPDGKPVYTDRKDTCPGAEESQPAGVVHHAETPEAAPRDTADVPAAAASEPARESADEAAAALWKGKRREAQNRIDHIHERSEWIRKYIGYCKPRSWITVRDEAGAERSVNCSELHSELASLAKQEAAAREYLDSGLADECRRAGCRPGWVR